MLTFNLLETTQQLFQKEEIQLTWQNYVELFLKKLREGKLVEPIERRKTKKAKKRVNNV
jgi:hypothetical protein